LLLIAVLMLAGLLAVAVNGGQAIPSNHPGFSVYLLLVCVFFYSWFWTHGGQTLGMRAWKVKLVSENGYAVSWQQAVLRFFVAIISWAALGIGVLWQWVSPQQRSWHDVISATHLERVLDKPLSK
jgi:uncharacterized RDD family membrane protein YckC